MPVLELFASSGLGSLVGMRHALEPDHLAAVSTLLTDQRDPDERRRRTRAAFLGVCWGLGHTAVAARHRRRAGRPARGDARVGHRSLRIRRRADAGRAGTARDLPCRAAGTGRSRPRAPSRPHRPRPPGGAGAHSHRHLDAGAAAAAHRRRARPRRQRRADGAGARDAAVDGGATGAT